MSYYSYLSCSISNVVVTGEVISHVLFLIPARPLALTVASLQQQAHTWDSLGVKWRKGRSVLEVLCRHSESLTKLCLSLCLAESSFVALSGNCICSSC